MRIVHIDNYEVCEENGKFLAASFVDYEGIPHTIELTKELEEYLKEVRKEEFETRLLKEIIKLPEKQSKHLYLKKHKIIK